MTAMFTDIGLDNVAVQRHSEFSAHDFAYLELRAARAYRAAHRDRLVKQEHGLLTVAEQQDELLLAGAELVAAIELWKAYR